MGLGSSFGLNGLPQPGRFDREAIGVAGVGEGVLLDVVDEALVARAAALGSGLGEESEVDLPAIEVPADGRVAEHEGIVHFLLIGGVLQHVGDRPAIAAVAEEQFIQSGLRERLRRLLQLGAQLLHDGRRLQVDEQLHQFAVHVHRTWPGNMTIEIRGQLRGRVLVGLAHADEDERVGAEQVAELLSTRSACRRMSRSSAPMQLAAASSLSPCRAKATTPAIAASTLFGWHDGTFCHDFDRLMLEPDPSRVADEPVRVAE